MRSLPEALTENFYLWEYRGRGWETYDLPVELEPPFIPFSRIHAPAREEIDDGRRPTFVSSFIEKVKSKFERDSAAESEMPSSEPAEYGVPPDPYAGEPVLEELVLEVPSRSDVPVLNVERLLLDFSYLENPLCFEIVGEGMRTFVRIACASGEADVIRKGILAYFPEAVVEANHMDHGRVSEESRTYTETGMKTAVVDFGLSEEFMRPIRTFRNFDPDPLTGIYTALENLRAGEKGVYQVIFRATRKPWAESILRSVTMSDGEPFFLDAPDMLALAKEKIGSILYAAAVRVAGMAGSEERAWEIARSLAGSLRTLSRPESNELMPLNDDGYGSSTHLQDLLRRTSRRTGMIMNIEELAGLIHPPSPSVVSERLSRDFRKTRPAPESNVSDGVRLGENIHQGRKCTVLLSPEQRLRHMHVIGATGTGKSTLLQNLIVQDMNMGNGLALLDPHGDLVESVLARVPQSRYEDVIIIDPSDSEYTVGFNILRAKSEIEKTVLSSDLAAIFKRFATSWGDQMTTVLGNAVSVFAESRTGGTLADLRRFLIEKDFRDKFLESVPDDGLKYFWRKEFHLLHGNPQASILTRLDSFLRPKLVRNIVTQKDGIDFHEIMDRRKILLVKLSQGLIGEENSFLLGALIVSKLHQVTMARQALDLGARRDFFLYIDEFQNFLTPSMGSVLSSSRKYRLGLVLAHQDLRQLYDRDKSIANSVISNAGTRVCFRLGDFDADKLADGFSHFTADDLQSLGVGDAIVRSDRSDHDFNLRTYPAGQFDVPGKDDVAEEVAALSRKKYGRRPEVTREASVPDTERREPEATKQEREMRPKRPMPPRNDERPLRRQIPVKKPVEDQSLSQHRYLQTLIKRMAEQRGYKAVIEERTPDGNGRADVGIERNGERIAFEVSITTDENHELQNVRKCLAAQYGKVVVVSPDVKSVTRIRKAVASELKEVDSSKVVVIQADDLPTLFEKDTRGVADHEGTVKGYRVKVQFPSGPHPGASDKRKAVADVILGSVRRLKGKE